MSSDPAQSDSKGSSEARTTAIVAGLVGALVLLLLAAALAWYCLGPRRSTGGAKESSRASYIYTSALGGKVDLVEQMEETPALPSPVFTPPPPTDGARSYFQDAMRYHTRSPSVMSGTDSSLPHPSRSRPRAPERASPHTHSRDPSGTAQLVRSERRSGESHHHDRRAQTRSPSLSAEYVMRYSARRSQSAFGKIGTECLLYEYEYEHERSVSSSSSEPGSPPGGLRRALSDADVVQGEERMAERAVSPEGSGETSGTKSLPVAGTESEVQDAVVQHPPTPLSAGFWFSSNVEHTTQSTIGSRSSTPATTTSRASSAHIHVQRPTSPLRTSSAHHGEPFQRAMSPRPLPLRRLPSTSNVPSHASKTIAEQVVASQREKAAQHMPRPARFYEDSGVRFGIRDGAIVPVAGTPPGSPTPSQCERPTSAVHARVQAQARSRSASPVFEAAGGLSRVGSSGKVPLRQGSRRAKDREGFQIGLTASYSKPGDKKKEKRISALSAMSEVPPIYTED